MQARPDNIANAWMKTLLATDFTVFQQTTEANASESQPNAIPEWQRHSRVVKLKEAATQPELELPRRPSEVCLS